MSSQDSLDVKKNCYQQYLIQDFNSKELFEPFPLSNIQKTYYLGRFNSFELGNVSAHFYTEYKYIYLDIEKLESTWNQLIARHLALRTVCVNYQQQFVKKPPYYKIELFELSCEQELLNLRNQFSHKVYVPDVYPLFDVIVSKLNDCYTVHISFDAILIDMNSLQILLDEWSQLYSDKPLALSNFDISYRDYAIQYEKIRDSELFSEAEKYWNEKLDDYCLEMNLPLKMHPSEINYPKFARITKTIKKETWNILLEKTKTLGISPTAFVLEIYGQVLSYWAGQSVLNINLTLFNRLPLHHQINDIIGDFTSLELFHYNRLSNTDKNNTIKQKLKSTHEELLTDIAHNLFDGIDFQRLIRHKKSIPINQIMSQAVLTSLLDNKNKNNLFDLPLNTSYKGVRYSISQTSQIWLNNKAYETTEGFVAEWDYVEQLFDNEMMQAMHDSYCYLIETLSKIDWETAAFPKLMLSKKDKIFIEEANNKTQTVSQDTLFSRYENNVLKSTLEGKVAIVDAMTSKHYTYKQLMQESDLFSRHLFELCHPTENSLSDKSTQLIGILSEKGYNQVLCTVSIMKSGCAYLPLHVDWPVGRLDEILEQGRVKILLISKIQYAKEHLRKRLSEKYTLIVVEDFLSQIHTEPLQMTRLKKVQLPKVCSDKVAYVIFTSGSTGKPKGVTISHQGALNTIDAVNEKFKLTEKDTLFALSELSFDLSVYDIFGILAVGGSIVFPDQNKTKDPSHWVQLINQYEVTLWDTVPQLAGLLIDELKGREETIGSLRLFLLSGDWIPTSLPDQIKQYCLNPKVISLGGATEGSIWSIWYEINSVPKEWSKIPYGIAMPNQKMYVLNQDSEHCPIGVIGEIHIGGMGVALNYWGNDSLTQDRFIHHKELGRLYKTGDLGRWHLDGYMEFIGRNDFQVKINGYRVELEEISAKLTKLKGIKEAVVRIQKHDGLDHMIAYLIPETDSRNETMQKTNDNKELSILKHYDKFDLNKNEIQKSSLKTMINQHLSEDLPDYMLPTVYVVLDELPLSANGKIDLDRLPKPEFCKTYTPPENDLEVKLSEIWSEILGLPSNTIGIHDNFFAIGGNSLMAVQLVIRLKNKLGVQLELMDLKNITIHEIGKRLKSQERDTNAVDTPRSNIIMIKEGDPNKQLPLIFIHPTGGDIYFYHGLASSLPDDQTMYAIRSPMLEGRKDFQSIEEMASSYIQAIENAGIKTPYALGGSSFGGIVAYHMAQILHAAKIDTPMLVLVDTPAYGNMPRALSAQEILEYLIKYGLGHLPISVAELRTKKSIDEQIQYMADIAKTTELKDMISPEFLPIFINTWEVNTVALLKYVPTFYTGTIIFFSHTDIIEEFPTNQHLHWVKYAKGKFKQFTVPGNHISMNTTPNIEIIAKHIYEAIQNESFNIGYQQRMLHATKHSENFAAELQ